MRIARLSWAGVEIRTRDRILFIDAMQNTAPLKALLGDPFWPPVAIPAWDGQAYTDALVTHPDHCDVDTIKRSQGAGGRVFCPMEIVPELEAAGLNARSGLVGDGAATSFGRSHDHCGARHRQANQ